MFARRFVVAACLILPLAPAPALALCMTYDCIQDRTEQMMRENHRRAEELRQREQQERIERKLDELNRRLDDDDK